MDPLTEQDVRDALAEAALDAELSGDAAEVALAELFAAVAGAWYALARQAVRAAARTFAERVGGSGTIRVAPRVALQDALSVLAYDLGPGLLARAAGAGGRTRSGVASAVTGAVEAAYGIGAGEGAVEVGVVFGRPDARALLALQRTEPYWVGRYYGAQLQDATREAAEAVLSGKATDAARAFRDAVEPVVGGARPLAYWRTYASNVTTRAQEWGRLGTYEAAGVEWARISTVKDGRRSPVCARLEGAHVRVADAATQRDRLVRAVDPEAVKKLAPWPSGPDALTFEAAPERAGLPPGARVAVGVGCPPYHGRCRSRLVAVVS